MIPEKFLARMREMPGLDFAAFEAALQGEAVRGLRVNTIKTDSGRVLPLLPFEVTPLPFGENAFYAPHEKVGGLALHHAGMIYMQDPSAVSAVVAAAPQQGWRVLDMCAAPGGKSTQLSAAIGNGGVLLSNEYVPQRCRILQGNIERMGAANTVVTNLDSAALALHYPAYFDLVVVDAPCSGEGMLRKYEVAGEEWSEENVALCAKRQAEILKNAAECVRPGGRLLYSTCTFSIEENEQNVVAFLEENPDFAIAPVASAVAKSTADGIAIAGKTHWELTFCRRFYPHISPGEGQFLAVMQRCDGDGAAARQPSDHAAPLSAADRKVVEAFLAETLQEPIPPQLRLCRMRDDVYLCPDLPLPPRGVFAAGVCLGKLIKGRVEPHHHFYSAFGKLFSRRLCLTADDARTARYLAGEEIDCADMVGADRANGYAAVLYEGAPLGGGKAVAGRLKNHYPKGLRNR